MCVYVITAAVFHTSPAHHISSTYLPSSSRSPRVVGRQTRRGRRWSESVNRSQGSGRTLQDQGQASNKYKMDFVSHDIIADYQLICVCAIPSILTPVHTFRCVFAYPRTSRGWSHSSRRKGTAMSMKTRQPTKVDFRKVFTLFAASVGPQGRRLWPWKIRICGGVIY